MHTGWGGLALLHKSAGNQKEDEWLAEEQLLLCCNC